MTPADDGSGAVALWRMADLVTPMAVRVAATLHVADHITAGRTTAAQIATAEQVDSAALDRLLRHLVHAGVLTSGGDGTYGLAPPAAALVDDDPVGLRALLDLETGLGRAELAFVHLLHSVRTGEAAYPTVFGRGFWADIVADPARRAAFDAQMSRDVQAWVPHIFAACDWSAFRHVVDVGGGDGTLLAELLRLHPTLRGTVVEQPATADAARDHLRVAGVDARATVVAGSFFDPLPAGADAYVLCAVLHDWDDRSAAAILEQCRDAAGASGRVLVIEKTGADGESTSTEMDLRVLVHFGGVERTAAAISALAEASGLRTVAVRRSGDLSLVELAGVS